MRCRSCECDIPPAFVTAIANNSCPGCGQEIMSADDKELLDSLAGAMERMPNDPQGLASWLLSNYRLQKIGSAEPVERFYRPVQKSQETNGFFDKQNIKINPDIAEKAQKLRENSKMAALADVMENFAEDEYAEEYEEDLEAEDQAAFEAMQREFLGKSGGTSEGIIKAEDLENMIKTGGTQKRQPPRKPPLVGPPSGGYETEDEKMLKSTSAGRNLLTKEQMKRVHAQQAILSGGGAFRRS